MSGFLPSSHGFSRRSMRSSAIGPRMAQLQPSIPASVTRRSQVFSANGSLPGRPWRQMKGILVLARVE